MLFSKNMLEHKQLPPLVRWDKLDQQTVVFIVAVNQDKHKKGPAEFYNVSFARSFVSSNAWPCLL